MMAAVDPRITFPLNAEEVAMAGDRLYFDRNPHADSYVRPVIHGEFMPFDEGDFPWVVVTQLGSGVRVREQLTGDDLAELRA